MKKILALALIPLALQSASVFAREVNIEITNLSHGSYFTPILIAAHDKETDLFEVGSSASTELQAMAEGGDISGLSARIMAAGGKVVENPAGGLLGPGGKTSASMKLEKIAKIRLSMVAMILPSNDGFVGLDSLSLPWFPGTYTYFLNGYDAGTEANDEIVNGGGMVGIPGIPAAPGGDNGANASGVINTETNQTVHIHRGVLGDQDPLGGISDLDSRIHRWLNPLAKVVITVGRR